MELLTIWYFILAALTLLIIPGPAVFYIMARSINQGKKAGLVSVLGVSLGGSLHISSWCYWRVSNSHDICNGILYQSAIVEAINPKTVLFFLAFFPQFISPSAGSVTGQFLILGTLFILLALMSDGLYALLAATIRKRLLGSKANAKLQNRITGSLYIALGVMSTLANPTTSD